MTNFGNCNIQFLTFRNKKDPPLTKVNINVKGGVFMLQIKSHQIQVTPAMQEAIYQQFHFIPEEDIHHLRLSIDSLNKHRLKIKAVYQLPKQKPLVVEVTTHDFYTGVDQLAKKVKQLWKRQTEKRRHRQDKIALGFAFKESEPQELPTIEEITVPVYRLTPEEAIMQFEHSNFPVFLYEDTVLKQLCTLSRKEDGSIEKQINIV